MPRGRRTYQRAPPVTRWPYRWARPTSEHQLAVFFDFAPTICPATTTWYAYIQCIEAKGTISRRVGDLDAKYVTRQLDSCYNSGRGNVGLTDNARLSNPCRTHSPEKVPDTWRCYMSVKRGGNRRTSHTLVPFTGHGSSSYGQRFGPGLPDPLLWAGNYGSSHGASCASAYR